MNESTISVIPKDTYQDERKHIEDSMLSASFGKNRMFSMFYRLVTGKEINQATPETRYKNALLELRHHCTDEPDSIKTVLQSEAVNTLTEFRKRLSEADPVAIYENQKAKIDSELRLLSKEIEEDTIKISELQKKCYDNKNRISQLERDRNEVEFNKTLKSRRYSIAVKDVEASIRSVSDKIKIYLQ